jgi:hypothetical protein
VAIQVILTGRKERTTEEVDDAVAVLVIEEAGA